MHVSEKSLRPLSNCIFPRISPDNLRKVLLSGDEIAVIDPRSFPAYLDGHLSVAASLPIEDIEDEANALLPRKSVPVVITDNHDGELAMEAARRLHSMGYVHVSMLEGGLQGWIDSGNELLPGKNGLAMALGELVERREALPRITGAELSQKLQAGEDIRIIDNRSTEEFAQFSIPGSIVAPGAELTYRIFDLDSSPSTQFVVTCAGRTRGILGAQSLLNIHVPHKVYALENGIKSWVAAGLELEHDASDEIPGVSVAGRHKAAAAAAGLAEKFDIRVISAVELNRFRAEASHRSLYIFDIRTPEEYVEGHLRDAVFESSSLLVTGAARLVAVRQARIVLVDTADLARSRLTAIWLAELGHHHVFVHAPNAEDMTEQGAVVHRPPRQLDAPAEGDNEPPLRLTKPREGSLVDLLLREGIIHFRFVKHE